MRMSCSVTGAFLFASEFYMVDPVVVKSAILQARRFQLSLAARLVAMDIVVQSHIVLEYRN